MSCIGLAPSTALGKGRLLPPPAPAPEPLQAPVDLQANKDGTKLKAKTSAREKQGIVNKGSGQLRIPLNTGTDKAPTGGLNV